MEEYRYRERWEVSPDQQSSTTTGLVSQVVTTGGYHIGEKANNVTSRDTVNNQGGGNVVAGSASTQSVNLAHAPSGEEWYYKRAEELKREHPDWTIEQITNKMSEIVWNNNYNALMDDIAHSKTPEEREQKIREHQEQLDKYRASGIKVDNDILYLREKQGMGSVVLSGAEWYDQEWRRLKAENPSWTDEQVTAEMTRRIEAITYNIFITDLANSHSPKERERMIREHQPDIDRFRAQGFDVDGHIEYLRETQGMPNIQWETLDLNYSLSDAKPTGIHTDLVQVFVRNLQYNLSPLSTAAIDSELIEQDKGIYHLELDEYNIYRRYNALGIMHPDDFSRWFADTASTAMLVIPPTMEFGVVGKVGAKLGKFTLSGEKVIKAEKEVKLAKEESGFVAKGLTERNPASDAGKWQGDKVYPGVDDWTNITLKKGTKVWGGAPGQSNFYTTDAFIKDAGNDATKIFEGLQVTKGKYPTYRSGMTLYIVSEDITVGYSKALANPIYGKGGAEQYFITNYEEILKPIKSIILTNK
jgi:hypothetical protein